MSSDSGTSWTEQTGLTGDVRSITCSKTTCDKMAVAVYNNNVYTSTDFGSTFLNGDSTISPWTGLASSNDGQKLVASGYQIQASTTTDGGISWTLQTDSPTLSWNPMGSEATGQYLIGGGSGSYLYTSFDSGVTWTERQGAETGQWAYLAMQQEVV